MNDEDIAYINDLLDMFQESNKKYLKSVPILKALYGEIHCLLEFILFPERRYKAKLECGFKCGLGDERANLLLAELKKKKLIQNTTKTLSFRAVMDCGQCFAPLVWCGSLRSLAWFIDRFCEKQPHRWKTTCECFVVRKGGKRVRPDKKPDFERIRIHAQQLKNAQQQTFQKLTNEIENDRDAKAVESIYNAMFPQQKQV